MTQLSMMAMFSRLVFLPAQDVFRCFWLFFSSHKKKTSKITRKQNQSSPQSPQWYLRVDMSSVYTVRIFKVLIEMFTYKKTPTNNQKHFIQTPWTFWPSQLRYVMDQFLSFQPGQQPSYSWLLHTYYKKHLRVRSLTWCSLPSSILS